MSNQAASPPVNEEENTKHHRSNRRQMIGMAAALTLFGGVPIVEMILNLASRS